MIPITLFQHFYQMPAEFSCVEKRKRMSSWGPSSKRAMITTKQSGVAPSLLHSGSTFRGQQRSRGSCYQVDVVLQVISGHYQAYPHVVLQVVGCIVVYQ